MNRIIEINFYDFFTKGKFDYVKIGNTKEWILNHFLEPDEFYRPNDSASIWTYGAIEFHFTENKLHLIWCDNLSGLADTSKLRLKKWFLEDLAKLTLSHVSQILNSEQIDYTIKFNKLLHHVTLNIEQSNVTFWFEGIEEQEESPSNYKMIAFGLNSTNTRL